MIRQDVSSTTLAQIVATLLMVILLCARYDAHVNGLSPQDNQTIASPYYGN
jgi:hypothetical protein